MYSIGDPDAFIFKGINGTNGEPINISLSDIRNRLNRLYSKSSVSVRALVGQDKDDFQTLVGYTKTLYDTPSYKLYYDEVKSVFGKLTNIIPGTVGAYFAGCATLHSTKNLKGCSAICAGSMPVSPEDGDSTTCTYPVYFANRDSKTGNYKFVLLHDGPNKDMVIVYIDGNHPFTGLSNDEKNQLKKAGAKKAEVLRWSDQDTQSDEVYQGFIDIASIPVRELTSSWGGSTIGWLILGFLLIVIIAGIIYYATRPKAPAAAVVPVEAIEPAASTLAGPVTTTPIINGPITPVINV
jgi:hypothetical protein